MINFLYSLIQFVIALFFILIGLIGMMIPWSATVREKLIHFILQDTLTISLFSLCFLVIGLAVAIHIIINSKRCYYQVRSGDYSVNVSETIIEQYVQDYWRELFPDRAIPSRILLKKNKVHVTADLPYLPLEQQHQLLERIKNDLDGLFKKLLGSKSEFNLFASFEGKPEEAKKIP